MDNRRRPDSRRESGQSPYARPAYAPSRPDAEPVAELVELGPVPKPKHRGVMPAALGLAVFAFGMLAGSSLVRLLPADTAEASASPVIGASGAPVGAVASGSPGPRATPRPTGAPRPTVQATPEPTNVPWAWSSGTFDTNEYGYPIGLWSVGGIVVIPVGMDNNIAFRTSADGVRWSTNASSYAIRDYQASTIVDDRLWYAMRITGLREDHLEIGYPVWAEDGANLQWKTKGPAGGPAPDWIGALGRIGDTWVMSPGRYIGDGGSQELWVSDDAVRWSTIMPAGAESVAIHHLQQLGSYLVGLGQLQSAEYAPVALRTKDGRHWSTMAFPGPSSGGTSIYRVACGTSACVAVGGTSTIGVERPGMWRTTDGLKWEAVGTDLTDARQDGSMAMVVATPSGFIAMGSPDQAALLSRDGTTWQRVRVLPQRDNGTVQQLTATGNLVFALGEQSLLGTAAQWIGDVGELPFP